MPVRTVTAIGPGVAVGETASCTVPVVGDCTVTGPKAPAAAPPTLMPGPNIAWVEPWTKLVNSVVIATVTVVPGSALAGVSDTIRGGGLIVSAAVFVLAKATPVVVLPLSDTRYAVGAVTLTVAGMLKVVRRVVPETVVSA